MVSQQFIYDETEAITQVVEAASAIGSLMQSFKSVAIAQQYYNLYAAQRQFYFSTFQQGVELPLIGDLSTDLPYTRNYAARMTTMLNANTGPYGGSSTDTVGWWTRHAAMYGSTPDSRITESAVDLPRVESDWANYLFRFEEYWYDVRNDQRWYKRMAVHNMGIKQGSAVVPALQYGLTNLTSQIGDMADQLATYGNGAAKFAGYRRGLSDVADYFAQGTQFRDAPSIGMRSSTDSGWKGVPFMQPGQSNG
jgi:hypothetical protein